MACKVTYLNTAGIMPREIKGVEGLSKAVHSDWLMYVAMNCFPRNQPSMEIDVVLVTNNRILLLEIKDWNGKLTNRGGYWYIGRQRRQRTPVLIGEEKAKKLASLIRAENPLAGAYTVESHVFLTGTATPDGLPPNEKQRVWTLSQAHDLLDPSKHPAHWRRAQAKLTRACDLKQEYDRIFKNPTLFQPLEADWAGYTVTEKDVFSHPSGVWAEHFAQRNSEPRMKAIVRAWDFSELPVGLNSGPMRKLIAMREANAHAYMETVAPELLDRGHLLREVVNPDDEIQTDHFEVRALKPNARTLDRFLVQNEDLAPQERVLMVSTLLSIISTLHRADVTHRDLGSKAIWVSSQTSIALTGFMSCQLPDRETVQDWIADLKGYGPLLPEDDGALISTGRQRDVYACAYLAALILTGAKPSQSRSGIDISALPPEVEHLRGWLQKGLAASPADRFTDAPEMMDVFADLVEQAHQPKVDQRQLDRFETELVPFVQWPQSGAPLSQSPVYIYISEEHGRQLIVKIWLTVRRNQSLQADVAMLTLLGSAQNLRESPISGLPVFVAEGLSATGPFVVYEHCSGETVENITALAETTGLDLVEQLLGTVATMHERGLTHGDIAFKNVLVDAECAKLFVIDPFDMSPVGNGKVYTPAMRPKNWETLEPQAIDRYSTLLVARRLLECDPSAHCEAVRAQIDAELSKPVIFSFEAVSLAAKNALKAARIPPTPVLVLRSCRDVKGFRDGSRYFVRHESDGSGQDSFVITDAYSQLRLRGGRGVYGTHNFDRVSPEVLAKESSRGRNDLPLSLSITQSDQSDSGFEALYAYLVGLPEFAGSISTAGSVTDAAPTSEFDIPGHWRRLIELEKDARVEILITEVIGSHDRTIVCACESTGKDFDFDDEDVIEVHGWNRRIGRVDLSQSMLPKQIAIDRSANDVRLAVGDRLRLAGRRDQTSIDRRAHAVDNILSRKSAIADLIDYFDPSAARLPVEYAQTISDENLASYGLNHGQSLAFRHLLKSGPIGLLQGPPGTGKTRFIASLVHWLLTEGGCQRILIASQSHEAVNNAADALLLLHKQRGDKPSMLRIGSKGISDRLRPYHTAEQRERYRVKFEAAAKFRYGQLIAALGVNKEYALALFDLDASVGTAARRCASAQHALSGDGETLALDAERNRVQQKRITDAFVAAYRSATAQLPDLADPLGEFERLVEGLLERFPEISPADALAARKALVLTSDWRSALGAPGRNFEEFLAKTRNVIAATCVGVGQSRIRIDQLDIDWVIVDEAARCTPGELAVPIQMAKRVLLVGDHLQLRPTIDSDVRKELLAMRGPFSENELTMSDFERAITAPYGKAAGFQLTEQYRMDKAICDMVSRCFYEPNGIALTTSVNRTPALSSADVSVPWLSRPMVWIDTSGHEEAGEAQIEDETSFHNRAEADAILLALDQLAADRGLVDKLASQDDETPIGVICMYRDQKFQLESLLARKALEPRFRKLVRVDTVDSYQGKENAVVLVSLVRSNRHGKQGHVCETNRCNVALSRAKDRLIVIGDRGMWEKRVHETAPMRKVVEYMVANPAQAAFIDVESLT